MNPHTIFASLYTALFKLQKADPLTEAPDIMDLQGELEDLWQLQRMVNSVVSRYEDAMVRIGAWRPTEDAG